MPAAAGRLYRDDVAGLEVARHLCRNELPVQQVAPGCSRFTAALALRRVTASLADDREATVLEHAQPSNDAVAAPMPACAARAEPQRIELDAQRVLQLERLDRGRERVRHRDVHAARPVRVRTRALTAADRLVVGEAVVTECAVVHRSLLLC